MSTILLLLCWALGWFIIGRVFSRTRPDHIVREGEYLKLSKTIKYNWLVVNGGCLEVGDCTLINRLDMIRGDFIPGDDVTVSEMMRGWQLCGCGRAAGFDPDMKILIGPYLEIPMCAVCYEDDAIAFEVAGMTHEEEMNQ